MGGGGSGKIRTWHNANGDGSRIASRRDRRDFSACYDTGRNSLRLGERDVKGGEDDQEGDGEPHVWFVRIDAREMWGIQAKE
jgi:hypothetical protein